MNLRDKLRLQEVKRFPICHTNREQSVAEHSFNVTMIALTLVEDENDHDLKLEVLLYSLLHDMDEVYTGDIPSSFKRRLRAECPSVIKLLDGDKFVPPEVKSIVKLADCLEAIYFLRQFGGSRTTDGILDDMVVNFHHAANTGNISDRIRLKAIELEKNL